MRVIGLDCATDDSKIGIALGEFQHGEVSVSRAEVCSVARSAVSVIVEWLPAGRDALLAIDAPLGWPVLLSKSLLGHRAGDALPKPPNEMFRRETDRFLKRQIGKTPLDVGADRIARTAHRALTLLAELRRVTGQPIPLAWNPGIVTSVAAIEVYPAATLVSNGFSSTGYKKAQQTDERIELTRHLASVLALPDHVATQMRANADALDAVVCLLAAKEFVEGRAMSPEDPELAKKEGWIWSAGVTEPSERAHRARPQLRSLGVYIPVDPQTESQVVKDTQGMTPKDVVGRAVL